jgi:hypothetical protein
MGFEQERFRQFSGTQGRLRFESDGNVQEKDYASANFMNEAGTIGYAEVEVDGKPDRMFVSRTAAGIVLTMPGEQSGPAPFPVEGYKALASVMSGSPAKAFYEAHLQALGGEAPLPDRAWLEHEVPMLAQRALDVTMKIFARVCEQMDKMMSGLGNAMGEMIEGMGKAMGEAMEGVGKEMGAAAGGAAGEAASLPEKAKLAPPEMARTPKAPSKKARPAGKAVAPNKKAMPVRKAAGPKMKAKPVRRTKAPVKKPKRTGGTKKRK